MTSQCPLASAAMVLVVKIAVLLHFQVSGNLESVSAS
jgi:hypothetical protein